MTQERLPGGKPVLYGIPNCDTVKKARVWLDSRGVAYRFHDMRKDGLDPAVLTAWADGVGWEGLLNRASTTFKALSPKERADLTRDKALALMLAQPTMIKRPVLELAGRTLVGFKPAFYEQALS